MKQLALSLPHRVPSLSRTDGLSVRATSLIGSILFSLQRAAHWDDSPDELSLSLSPSQSDGPSAYI